MSTYEVISEVSKTLKQLLEDNMTTTPLTIVLSTPDEEISNSTNRINLFLYQVVENVQLKNQDWQMSSPTKIKPPPLSLNLFYLLTPYPQNPNDYTNAHLILGEAMRIFFDQLILVSDYLSQAAEEVKLILNPINMDEMTKIWSAINKPYRLSVSYEVSVVQIESSVAEREVKPVKERKVEIKPYSGPPRIEKLDPESGNPGTRVRIIGNNLKGEFLKVNIGGKPAGGIVVASDSEISFIVPTGLPPYLYKVTVIVNGQVSNPANFEVLGG